MPSGNPTGRAPRFSEAHAKMEKRLTPRAFFYYPFVLSFILAFSCSLRRFLTCFCAYDCGSFYVMSSFLFFLNSCVNAFDCTCITATTRASSFSLTFYPRFLVFLSEVLNLVHVPLLKPLTDVSSKCPFCLF